MIFAECMNIAIQLPWGLTWHERPALLLHALKKQPAQPPQECEQFAQVGGWSFKFKWSDFPTFGMQQGESYDYKCRDGLYCPEYDSWSP
jgi:hypothetical protein